MLRVAVLSALAAAFIGVICGWYSWRRAALVQTFPAWRRVTSSLGLLAMTAQALLLVALFMGLADHFPGIWLLSEFALFPVAGTALLAEKSTSKWWLFASSAYFLLYCILMILGTSG